MSRLVALKTAALIGSVIGSVSVVMPASAQETELEQCLYNCERAFGPNGQAPNSYYNYQCKVQCQDDGGDQPGDGPGPGTAPCHLPACKF